MTEQTLKIEGMHCQHCVMRVEKALKALEGIDAADVQVGSAKVKYDESRVTIEQMKKAIEEAGYKVVD